MSFKDDIVKIYDGFPDKLKTYKNKCLMKSVALDWLMLQDIEAGNTQAMDAALDLFNLATHATEENIERLIKSLDIYYASRRENGKWEKRVFGGLKMQFLCPVFILSYGRSERNATLDRIDRWNDAEVYDNTMVFVQPEQEEAYMKHHPKFHYYAKSVNSVGERMLEVLKFCRHWGIKHCIVLEDDIAEFRHIKKGGVSGNSKISTAQEEWGGCYLKYYYSTGLKIMKEDPDCVLVGVRNRAMGNNESTSLIGYHDPMRGGCPNMVYFLDVDKFYPIYKTIPEEHYSPQYDWAIQCAIIRAKKHWSMITGIVKNEYNSKSVIGFSGDRERLAEEMIRYYGVQDYMSYRRFKDTELQGVKLFYSPRGYDDNLNKTLF